jgi:hypothetical protein
MNLVHWVKSILLGFCISLLVIPVTSVYAQPEDEEEEEPVQTRPNPMDSRIRMKGASRSGNPSERVMDDGQHGDGKIKMGSPASKAAPAQRMQMGPQGMQPGKAISYEGVDGESMGSPMGTSPGMQQMQGIKAAPQVQDDGEHGTMMLPQQMGR